MFFIWWGICDWGKVLCKYLRYRPWTGGWDTTLMCGKIFMVDHYGMFEK